MISNTRMRQPRNISRGIINLMTRYEIKPNPKQIMAINNFLSGQFKSLASAMRDAGYSEKSSYNARHVLLNRRGVQVYMESMSDIAQKRWGMSLPEKVMMTYFDGLKATKGGTTPQPDWMVRMVSADRFAFLLGWTGKTR